MLDRTDLQLLDALQRDATLSMAQLGERVGLSATPCWKRIKRLQDEGYITARLAILDRKKVGLPVTVFVSVRTSSIDGYDRFYKKLIRQVGLSGVSSAFSMEQIKSTSVLPLDAGAPGGSDG